MAKTYRPKSRARRHDLQTLLVLLGWVAVRNGIRHSQHGDVFCMSPIGGTFISYRLLDREETAWDKLSNGNFYSCYRRAQREGWVP